MMRLRPTVARSLIVPRHGDAWRQETLRRARPLRVRGNARREIRKRRPAGRLGRVAGGVVAGGVVVGDVVPGWVVVG